MLFLLFYLVWFLSFFLSFFLSSFFRDRFLCVSLVNMELALDTRYAGIELRDTPTFASQLIGLKVYTTTIWRSKTFLRNEKF